MKHRCTISAEKAPGVSATNCLIARNVAITKKPGGWFFLWASLCLNRARQRQLKQCCRVTALQRAFLGQPCPTWIEKHCRCPSWLGPLRWCFQPIEQLGPVEKLRVLHRASIWWNTWILQQQQQQMSMDCLCVDNCENSHIPESPVLLRPPRQSKHWPISWLLSTGRS